MNLLLHQKMQCESFVISRFGNIKIDTLLLFLSKKKFSNVENSRPVLDQLCEINSQFGISTVKGVTIFSVIGIAFLRRNYNQN